MRQEEITGYVARTLETQQNTHGKTFGKFEVVVFDEEARRVYYSCLVFDELVDFCRTIAKDAQVTCCGRVEENSYKAKDGTQRSKPIMRIQSITLDDGRVCRVAPAVPVAHHDTEDASRIYEKMLQEPPRWSRAAWWASPGGQAFYLTPEGRSLYDQVEQGAMPEFTEERIDPHAIRAFVQSL